MVTIKKVLTTNEARQLCPVCRKYNPKMDKNGFETPMCLHHPGVILPEEKEKCLFAKYAGYPIVQVLCDFCGKEIRHLRFIDGVHKPPEPTIDGLFICRDCIKKPEHENLRIRLGIR